MWNEICVTAASSAVRLAGPWGGVPGLGAMLPYGAVAAMDYAVAAGSFHPRQSPVNPAFTHSWYVI